MIIYLLVTLTVVALAALIKKPTAAPVLVLAGHDRRQITRQQMLNSAALSAVVTILFGVAACRLNVGNDYAKYVEFMHLVVSDSYVPTEVGFNWLVRILYGISGFENYLLVFAFFALATIVIFIGAIYKQSTSFIFSFFLFMAFAYYFQSFSTVRYYLAVAVALYSIPYVLRREWVKFLLLILLGATFHKSLLVVIPLYFLASLKWKKWTVLPVTLVCVSFFFFQEFYLRVLVFLYPTYENTDYLDGGTSYVNILRCAAVLVLSLLYYRQTIQDNPRNRFYFYCNAGALILYTCCSFIPVISRIGYYLTVTHIFFLPVLAGGIRDSKLKRLFTWGIVAAGILYFAMYMLRAGEDGVRILPYQTFLFHDMPPILSDVN